MGEVRESVTLKIKKHNVPLYIEEETHNENNLEDIRNLCRQHQKVKMCPIKWQKKSRKDVKVKIFEGIVAENSPNLVKTVYRTFSVHPSHAARKRKKKTNNGNWPCPPGILAAGKAENGSCGLDFSFLKGKNSLLASQGRFLPEFSLSVHHCAFFQVVVCVWSRASDTKGAWGERTTQCCFNKFRISGLHFQSSPMFSSKVHTELQRIYSCFPLDR